MRDPIYTLTVLLIFGVTVDYRFFSGIEGFPSITIVEGLTYLAVILLGGKLALERDELGKRMLAIYRENKPVVWYFIWTGLASLVSLTRSTDALRYYKDLLPSLIIYFLVASYINNAQAIKSCIVAFLSGTALNLILGFCQALTGGPRIVGMSEAANLKMTLSAEVVSGHLATGLFSHPNGYALFLVPAAILIPTLLFRSRSVGVPRRVLLLAVWLLLGYNLWNTYAKVAYAFIIIGLALILVIGFFKRWHLAMGLAVLVASILGIVAYSLWAYVEKGRLFGTMLTRYELWKGALLAIRSDMFVAIFGNGFANMTGLSVIYAHIEYPNAHNAYLNQVIYYGFPALLLYMSMSGLSLGRLAEVLETARDWLKSAALFLFSALISLLGIYFFEPANQGVVEQAHFFILLALATTIRRMNSNACGKTYEKDRYLQNGIPSSL